MTFLEFLTHFFFCFKAKQTLFWVHTGQASHMGWWYFLSPSCRCCFYFHNNRSLKCWPILCIIIIVVVGGIFIYISKPQQKYGNKINVQRMVNIKASVHTSRPQMQFILHLFWWSHKHTHTHTHIHKHGYGSVSFKPPFSYHLIFWLFWCWAEWQ